MSEIIDCLLYHFGPVISTLIIVVAIFFVVVVSSILIDQIRWILRSGRR